MNPHTVEKRTSSDKSHGRRTTVLVVDDEDWVREIAQEFLERAGFQVLCVAGGHEALELLGTKPMVDAVLLDWMMPDLGGEETLLGIHRLCPGLPVVATSGIERELGTEQLDAIGLRDFLCKPYEPEELVDSIHSALKP